MWRLSHLKILLETVEVCNSVLQRNRTDRRYIDRWWVDRSIHRCIDEYDYICRIVIYCQSEYCVSLTIPRKGLQTLLPAASWYWSNQGKHNAIKHWMEQVLTHTEKRQQVSLRWYVSVPHGERILPTTTDAGQLASTNLFPASLEGPGPLTCGIWNAESRKQGICLRATDTQA